MPTTRPTTQLLLPRPPNPPGPLPDAPPRPRGTVPGPRGGAGRRARVLAGVTLGVLFVGGLIAQTAPAPIAHAQLEGNAPGQFRAGGGATFDIIQDDRHVGEIFVPARAPGTVRYVEHWVLFPGYVYPGPTNGKSITVRPAGVRYADEREFVRRVPFAPGSRYIRVDSTDGDSLPGRPR